jgi:hypothetical protein
MWALLLVPLLALLAYVVWRVRLGHLIGVHLFLFEQAYDVFLRESGSTQLALRESLNVFKSCPRLNQLMDAELDRFSEIVGVLPDPKRIVNMIVLKLDSKQTLKAFRDESFLREVSAVYSRKPGA